MKDCVVVKYGSESLLIRGWLVFREVNWVSSLVRDSVKLNLWIEWGLF